VDEKLHKVLMGLILGNWHEKIEEFSKDEETK
jgi:hypothetical protein